MAENCRAIYASIRNGGTSLQCAETGGTTSVLEAVVELQTSWLPSMTRYFQDDFGDTIKFWSIQYTLAQVRHALFHVHELMQTEDASTDELNEYAFYMMDTMRCL